MQQLAIHTVGGVVTPAQALLAVVPSAETLEVEATVLNKDAGFVRAGQRATVKVESFPYTRHGYLEGVVESVSHDAAQDENLGLVFQSRVKLAKASLVIDGVTVALTPGMATQRGDQDGYAARNRLRAQSAATVSERIHARALITCAHHG